ncbi:MAG TPA: hypothetical protein VNX68_00980 [Nitrosopumilaceae archaeon]|jgi:hypothetical protein|nr:hypothetical protein [Nitrosopumilaceae archaeon]
MKTQFLKVEETELTDTWYVELPNGYKGYVPTKLLVTILKNISKEIKS